MPKKLLYHGTNGRHARAILNGGLLPSHTGRLGAGYYLAEEKWVAERIAENHHGRGCALVLVFEVELDRVYDWDTTRDAHWQSKGYTSATGMHPPWAGVPQPFREYCVVGLDLIRGPVQVFGDIQPSKHAVYMRNVGNPCFLDTHGEKVWVWGDGQAVGVNPVNLQWEFVPVPGEPDTFYIVNKGHNKFLDSHGSTVSLWGDGRDTGVAPRNIQWRRILVDGVPDTYYIIHSASNKFLDTHGVPSGSETGAAGLWGDGVDTGKKPQNLQWELKLA